MDTMSLMRFLLCVLAFHGILRVNGQSRSSHNCYKTRSTQEWDRRSGKRACGLFGLFRCNYYYYKSRTVYSQQKVCCTGWRGTNCNIPVCSPSCKNSGVCYDRNRCYCRPGSGGSQCGTPVYCSFTNDCYPGTCAGSSCRCSSGFEGTTCATIRDGGQFETCTAIIDSEGQTPYQTDCITPNENSYTNRNNLQGIKLEWKVNWELPSDTPPAPSYAVESRPGVINTYATIQLLDNNGLSVTSRQQVCTGHEVSATNPHLTVECRNVFHTVNPSTAQHNYKLSITFHSQTGGYKIIKNEIDQQVSIRNYQGRQHESEALVIEFDVMKPQHCTQTNPPCTYSQQPALAVYPDAIQGNEIPVQIFGWEDEDSGIAGYRFELYRLQYNVASAKLEQQQTLEQIDWQIVDDPPILTVDQPGVYSVVMEILDRAGNSAKARTIVILETDNHVEVEEGQNISVDPSTQSEDGGIWIEESGNFEVAWENLFRNRKHVDDKYLVAVAPVNDVDMDDDGRDEGNRTIHEVGNFHGIVRFGLGWRKLPSNKVNWLAIDSLAERFTISNVERQDGDVLEVTVNGSDVTNFFKSHTTQVSVDSSLPTMGSQPQVEYNVESDIPAIHYASRVQFDVKDEHSGIGTIRFTMFDTSGGTDELIYSGTQSIQSDDSLSDSSCRHGRCYCIPAGPCYNNIQSLWLDNCWFAHKGVPSSMTIEYTIANNAGLSTLSNRHHVSTIDELEGIGLYPVPQDIGTTRNRGEEMDVFWYLPPSCYTYKNILIEYTQKVKHVAHLGGNVSRHRLHGLIPNSRFDLAVTVTFEDGTQMTTDKVSFSTEYIEPHTIGAGGIVGIVIACLVFLVLITVLLYMFVRFRKHQHPLPLILRKRTETVRDRVRNRLSFHPAQTPDAHYEATATDAPQQNTTLNVAYVSEEDDMYVYGNMDTDPNATWKHSQDSITITGNVPGARGRFADLKLGTLREPGGSRKIVVKMNKPGASEDDKLLMTAKMNYLATAVPKHDLIVGMIGAIPPPKGPMILMEYCDSGTLMQWLEKLGRVSGDIEEQMVTFATQTATGMALLHDKGILHRRLGARNVLLHTIPQTKQLLAKLCGFGPLKGEQDDSAGRKNDRVPIKWMAPEQMNKPAGKPRLYSKQTDVWSYGILAWEIFSKGGKPYADKTPGEMKRSVLGGNRMPKPRDCPDFIYTSVITPCWVAEEDSRPSFETLLVTLSQQYGAQAGDIYEYDAGYYVIAGNTGGGDNNMDGGAVYNATDYAPKQRGLDSVSKIQKQHDLYEDVEDAGYNVHEGNTDGGDHNINTGELYDSADYTPKKRAQYSTPKKHSQKEQELYDDTRVW